MFVRITPEQVNLIKELCLIEIENCARHIAENQVAASEDPWDRRGRIAQLYQNRGECLIDFLEQLELMRRV